MERDETAERAQRRRMAIAVGTACLVLGLIVGVAIGSGGGDDTTTTITHVRDVVQTQPGATKTVPVVHVKTVTKPHYIHVVRTQTVHQTRTVTVREAAPSAPSAPVSSGSDGGSDGSQYAGENCSEIGHSFNVTPGSDPEHDADNDGIACESEG